MAEIDTSMYRQAPVNSLSGIGEAIGIANSIKQNQMLDYGLQMKDAENQILQGNLQGQTQYGNALSSTLNPDGSFNPAAAAKAYTSGGGNPIYAPSAANHATGLAGANISNTNAASTGGQNQIADTLAAMNAIAEAGGKRSQIFAEAAKRLNGGLISPGAFHSIVDNLPPDDKGAASYIKTKTAGMIAAPAQAAPAVAGFDPNTLQPILKPGASVTAAAGKPGGTIITPAPGATEVAASDKKAMFEDQLRASNTMGNVRTLQATLPLIGQLSNANFGPGSAEFAKLKGALATAGVIDPNASDATVRQEVNKYLLQYASGAAQAGRSDAALSAALGSNPNLDLTQPANLALIKNQIARDRMDASIPKAYGVERKEGQNYSEYKSGFYQGLDQRAFGFDLMSPQERAAVQKSLGAKGSPAYEKFIRSYNIAKQAGMLQPAQGQ